MSPKSSLKYRDIGGAVITYGRIPLMITERCFTRELSGCGSCGGATLVDRTGAVFPVMRELPHRNIIFNSSYTYMADKVRELADAGINHTHFILSNESARDAKYLFEAYFNKRIPNVPIRRMGRREK